MPSKLPIIKANTTQINIDKMKVIAEKNKRSLAKELELIIENHIREYEKENGEIKIEDSTPESIKDMLKKSVETMKDPNLSITEKIASSYNYGAKYENKLGEEFVENRKKKK